MAATSFWRVLKQTGADFLEDRAMRLAAAMAYYALFSIGPLLFLVITVGGWVTGEEAVRAQLHETLRNLAGEQAAKTMESMMASPRFGQNILTTVLAIASLVLGAAGVFGQLQDALNTIWEVRPKPGQGIQGVIRNRLLSMTMVLGLGFLLLVSMVLTTAVEAATARAGQILPVPDVAVALLSAGASFVVVTFFFAALYKTLPDAQVRWRYVWGGAIFAALLFTVGKYLLSLYLGKQATSSAYGAAGSVIAVLLWVYYSSIILFVGAEFTQAYARSKGAVIAPSPHAVRVTAEERAQQGMPSPERLQEQRAPVVAPVHARPRPAPGRRPLRPAFAFWLGFGVVASWWLRRHRPANRS